jgi:hypothetical protein
MHCCPQRIDRHSNDEEAPTEFLAFWKSERARKAVSKVRNAVS